MKNSEEMVNSLLMRREKYNTDMKRKRKTLIRAATALCCVCLAVAACFALLGKDSAPELKTEDSLVLAPFVPAGKDPTGDAFSVDELRHVDVVLDGVICYRQLTLDEYEKYGFDADAKALKYGELLGTVVETSGNDKSVAVGSQEPTLAGCKVYYIAGKAKSTLVATDGYKCSLFVLENMGGSFENTYAIYGASSAEDIAFLDYVIQGEEDGEYKIVESGKITDVAKITDFYNITKGLVPYEIPSGISATPDWLNKAWEEYKANPESRKREDITVSIYFKNGAILEYVGYQPFLATGYVNGMELLTAEQNAELRAIFTAD